MGLAAKTISDNNFDDSKSSKRKVLLGMGILEHVFSVKCEKEGQSLPN